MGKKALLGLIATVVACIATAACASPQSTPAATPTATGARVASSPTPTDAATPGEPRSADTPSPSPQATAVPPTPMDTPTPVNSRSLELNTTPQLIGKIPAGTESCPKGSPPGPDISGPGELYLTICTPGMDVPVTVRIEQTPLPGQPALGAAELTLSQGYWRLRNLALPAGAYRISAHADAPGLVMFPQWYDLPYLSVPNVSEGATWRFSDIRFQLTKPYDRPFHAQNERPDFSIGGSFAYVTQPSTPPTLSIYRTQIPGLVTQVPSYMANDIPVVAMPVNTPAPATAPIARFQVSNGPWAYMGDGLYAGSYLVVANAQNVYPKAWLVNLPAYWQIYPSTDALAFAVDANY